MAPVVTSIQNNCAIQIVFELWNILLLVDILPVELDIDDGWDSQVSVLATAVEASQQLKPTAVVEREPERAGTSKFKCCSDPELAKAFRDAGVEHVWDHDAILGPKF